MNIPKTETSEKILESEKLKRPFEKLSTRLWDDSMIKDKQIINKTASNLKASSPDIINTDIVYGDSKKSK